MLKHSLVPVCAAALGLLAGSVLAKQIMAARWAPQPPAGAGTVNLPCQINDPGGNNWYIYQNGSFRQQNNQPVYSQGGQLLINGNYPNANSNVARQEAKTGEIIIENLPGQGCTVSRRLLVNKEEGYIRIIDIIRNTQGQDLTANVMMQSQFNYSIQANQNVADPRNKNQTVGWVGHTSANRSVVQMLCGRSAKTPPTITYQPGNSYVQATWALTIPPNGEVAVMHVHATSPTLDAGTKWIAGVKESKLMADIPPAIRKLIVNFRAGASFIGDMEVLRGETLDVIELRGGDSLKGTLRPQSYKLKTFYGPVELPASRVVGLINVGEYRPRQLLVTTDGEIFGGQLDAQDLAIELSSGQEAAVPLAQFTRAGYRKRPGEPEEWTFEKPMVAMRTGERMIVQAPDKPLEVFTRYGGLKLSPSVLAAVAFQAEEHGVHQIILTDGSRFAGLVMGETFEMKLAAGEQAVRFPASAIARLQFSPKVDDPDDATAVLSLANEDSLVGTLVGQLKLDTAFSTIALNAPEIRRLARTKNSTQDMQVEIWDQTTVSGQFQEQEVTVKLKCGVEMKVPVALVEEYVQPRPTPSAAAAQNIAKLVADLSADDWQVRDEAQKKLITMGNVVIGLLKELRPKQTPEGQQRIDQIVKELEKSDRPAAKTPAGTSGAAIPQPMPQVLDCGEMRGG